VAEALLDLLADHLEDGKDRKALSEELARIMEKVDKHLDRQGPEKIERFNLESLKRNLSTLHRRIEALPKETITQELERLALLAEDLAKTARMQEVEALAREIRNRQQQLIDALRDQKGPLAQETLQALLKELEKLKDLISRVMEALSRMATQDEPINSSDLSGLDSGPVQGPGRDSAKAHGRRPGRSPRSGPEIAPESLADDGCHGEGRGSGRHGLHGPASVRDVSSGQ
jgi:hypothetical protein